MKELFAFLSAMVRIPLGLWPMERVRPTKHANPAATAIGLILMVLVVLPISIYYSGWKGVSGPLAWLFVARVVVKIRWTPILLIAQALIALVAFPVPAEYDIFLIGWSMFITGVYVSRSNRDNRQEYIDERFQRKT